MYLLNTTQYPKQAQTFNLFGKNMRFNLNYNSVLPSWTFDLYDLDKDEFIAQNYGLAVNCPSLIEMNYDFVILMLDESTLGVNPVDINEMGKRLFVYIVDKADYYEAIRS